MSQLRVLNLLMQEATNPASALDSVSVTQLTGLAPRSVSAWLCIIHGKGYAVRVLRCVRKDRLGRKRRTFAYYIPVTRPEIKPKRQPFTDAALRACYACR